MHADPKSTRLLLDKDELESLPLKEVDGTELWDAMTGWFYNSTLYYPKGVKRHEGEQGHDHKHRYILKPE